MNAQKIGKFIKKLREEKSLSQYELAEAIPIGREAVSKWERGIALPDYPSLLRLCEIFNVTSNELLYGEKINNDNKNSLNNVTLNLYKDKRKNKKIIFILSFIIFILMFLFLLYYLLVTYNSVKIYNVHYEKENFSINNGIIIKTRDKIFFNLGSYLGVFMRGLYELILKNI